MTKLSYFCTCGSGMKVNAYPIDGAMKALAIFKALHLYAGCSETDQATAKRAEAENERENADG